MTPPDSLRVVGVDPGLANLGLGAVEERGRAFRQLGAELITTTADTPQEQRLLAIHRGVDAFLERHRPQALALEGQFFHRQREVSFKVGQAVGVVLLVAAQRGVPVFEYGPMQVKQALVGTGKADKAQVAFMVRGLLGLKGAPASHHVADALALALTHLGTLRFAELER